MRKLYERLVYLRNLEEKKEQVISSIEEQGKLTEELKKQILAAETLVAVEDLYRPYRPKRRTRATIAKEKGLEPSGCTDHIAEDKRAAGEDSGSVYFRRKRCGNVQRMQSAEHVILLQKAFQMRQLTEPGSERSTMRKGKVTSQAKDPEAESVYEMYYEFAGASCEAGRTSEFLH